jgi:uncharacterized protein (TIGR03435 family)
MAASLKFLVPFSLLMSVGSWLPRPVAAPTTAPRTIALPSAPNLAVVVDHIAQPFTEVFAPPTAQTQPRHETNWIPTAVAGIWICGVIAIAGSWLLTWRRIYAAVRTSTPLDLARAIPVHASSGLLEPGVVGWWRPVLLVPEGLERYLTPRQLEAVIVHELCHVRRRDNLTAAMHMVVESVFWFHPVVWWIGARLVDERERACDEHVLRVCGEPEVYAESILSVCKLYVESPLMCVSGVSGLASPKRIFGGGAADLKKRLEAIMVNRIGRRLNVARKLGIALIACLAILLPVAAGMITAPLRASAAGQGQATAGAIALRFEVVSIKSCPGIAPRPPGSGRAANPGAPQITPGYAHWDCVGLYELINQAYAGGGSPARVLPPEDRLLNVLDRPREDTPKRVRGGPDWLNDEKFAIEVKLSGDATDKTGAERFIQVRDAMVPALRAMLVDRFQLKLHKATEQQPMYAMTVGKDGLKIPLTAPSKCWDPPRNLGRQGGSAPPPPGYEGTQPCGYDVHGVRTDHGNQRREIKHVSMPNFATYLSEFMDRYVVDRTGVDGRFSFTLEFAPDDHTPVDLKEMLSPDPGFNVVNGVRVPLPPEPPLKSDGIPIMKALEVLGLILTPTNGPSEYWLIDSVQRPRPNSPEEIVARPAPAPRQPR